MRRLKPAGISDKARNEKFLHALIEKHDSARAVAAAMPADESSSNNAPFVPFSQSAMNNSASQGALCTASRVARWAASAVSDLNAYSKRLWSDAFPENSV